VTLRELRKSRDLTLASVADATGIFIGTLSMLERGLALPTPAQIVGLSRFYGVDLEGWRFIPEHEPAAPVPSPQAAA
jgi:transcriptional regulator with XRE-family HTH domain